MKKERKKKPLVGVLLCCLAVGIFLPAGLYFREQLNKIPDSILFVPSEELFLPQGQSLSSKNSSLVAGTCSTVDTNLGKAAVIDETYQELESYEIETGRKIDFSDSVPQALLLEKQASVLGKDLEDVIEIEGKEYQVVGILRETPFWNKIFRMKPETIILNQFPDEADVPVDRILFWSKNQSFLYAKEFSFELNSMYEKTLTGTFHHIGLIKKMLESITFIWIFFLWFPVLWTGLVYAAKWLLASYQCIKHSFRKSLFKAVVGLLLIVAECSVWCFLLEKIIPPQQYLPAEQIFDVKYYFSEVIGFYQSLSGKCGTIVSIQLLARFAAEQVVVCVVSVLLFWSAWILSSKKRKNF